MLKVPGGQNQNIRGIDFRRATTQSLSLGNCESAPVTITFSRDLHGMDWQAFREDLIADDFHNGRTTHQLQLSFERSQHVAVGFDEGRCIASGRMLSDGVGNAYVLDVWTASRYRRQGIASWIMTLLLDQVPGQHVYLQTDDALTFYRKLGFRRQPDGLSLVVGDYLNNTTST